MHPKSSTKNYNMRKLQLLLCLVTIVFSSAEAKRQQQLSEKDMGAYLFTYFNDPTHSLFMAISYDGYIHSD